MWLNKLCSIFLGALILVAGFKPASAAQTFPLLFGMNIGAKNYDDVEYQKQIAKLDAAVLGFYRGWRGDKNGEMIRPVLQNIKAINPNILLGQYTVLNETYNDPKDVATTDKRNKIIKENWWLRDKNGKMLQWTSRHQAWDINITNGTKQDSNKQRYPQWLANRDYQVFFKNIPEFDIWYFDNVMWRPRLSQAAWSNPKINQSNNDPLVQKNYRLAHVSEWAEARKLAPNLLQLGNTDNDLSSIEYKGKLQGAFLEAIMGKIWSIGTWKGWDGMMDYYHQVVKNTIEPHMVVFNVFGLPSDFKFFRFSFTSCLMDNGYYSFTDENKGFSSVPWFDEYDIDLGAAIDGPQYTANSSGIYLRRFEKGLVLVNPTLLPKTIALPAGYSFFRGKQDFNMNNGNIASQVKLSGRDGVILVKN